MSWQVQTAKAKFSELLRATREQGPQTITVRGKEEFVILTKDAFEKGAAQKRQKSWDEFYAPVQGLGDDLVLPLREVEPVRVIDFSEG